ncbi:MAG: asparaginase domain-containing protein [Deltaproteobacteria bacterium]|jgi:L-asparaginase|nr:asparaginase domain-containing protein [Deltaproteobacteria bacterium]
MENNNIVHVMLTGGTIDSKYDPENPRVDGNDIDPNVPYEHSIVPEFFKTLELDGKFEFTEVYMKDSRDVVPEEIENLLTTIENSQHKQFIVTHGTYTMQDTAKYLERNLLREDATVVLTGSMFIPHAPEDKDTIARLEKITDARLNLGFAYAHALNSPPGVYVCIKLEKYTPDNMSKLH